MTSEIKIGFLTSGVTEHVLPFLPPIDLLRLERVNKLLIKIGLEAWKKLGFLDKKTFVACLKKNHDAPWFKSFLKGEAIQCRLCSNPQPVPFPLAVCQIQFKGGFPFHIACIKDEPLPKSKGLSSLIYHSYSILLSNTISLIQARLERGTYLGIFERATLKKALIAVTLPTEELLPRNEVVKKDFNSDILELSREEAESLCSVAFQIIRNHVGILRFGTDGLVATIYTSKCKFFHFSISVHRTDHFSWTDIVMTSLFTLRTFLAKAVIGEDQNIRWLNEGFFVSKADLERGACPFKLERRRVLSLNRADVSAIFAAHPTKKKPLGILRLGTNTLVATIQLPKGQINHQILFTKDGQVFVVGNSRSYANLNELLTAFSQIYTENGIEWLDPQTHTALQKQLLTPKELLSTPTQDALPFPIKAMNTQQANELLYEHRGRVPRGYQGLGIVRVGTDSLSVSIRTNAGERYHNKIQLYTSGLCFWTEEPNIEYESLEDLLAYFSKFLTDIPLGIYWLNSNLPLNQLGYDILIANSSLSKLISPTAFLSGTYSHLFPYKIESMTSDEAETLCGENYNPSKKQPVGIMRFSAEKGLIISLFYPNNKNPEEQLYEDRIIQMDQWGRCAWINDRKKTLYNHIENILLAFSEELCKDNTQGIQWLNHLQPCTLAKPEEWENFLGKGLRKMNLNEANNLCRSQCKQDRPAVGILRIGSKGLTLTIWNSNDKPANQEIHCRLELYTNGRVRYENEPYKLYHCFKDLRAAFSQRISHENPVLWLYPKEHHR